MTLDALIGRIKRSGQHNYVYHFTDESNFPLIREHGLLSKSELRKKNLWPVPAPAGNQWSWDADDKKGVSSYVSLCMTRNHPMKFVAVEDQRISRPRYLAIDPDILRKPGVLICSDVANKTGVVPSPIEDIIGELDLQVLYTRTDWKDPKIRARLNLAEKYEVLVPTRVPKRFIKRVF